ncbi:hypothetical protein ACJX0J_034840, partial [Zea mays]
VEKQHVFSRCCNERFYNDIFKKKPWYFVWLMLVTKHAHVVRNIMVISHYLKTIYFNTMGGITIFTFSDIIVLKYYGFRTVNDITMVFFITGACLYLKFQKYYGFGHTTCFGDNFQDGP